MSGYSFTFENQGINSFLVYSLKDSDKIDTFTSGMISNNKIQGLLPFAFSQIDENRYFKYNITSRVSLKQFLAGVVNKKRLLGAFSSIASALIESKEYMLEEEKFILDLDYIFVDVSSCSASVICLPVLNLTNEKVVAFRFFKDIMYSSQFDNTESCDYVAKLISYLNSNICFSLQEFKKLLHRLLEVPGTGTQAVQSQVSQVRPAPKHEASQSNPAIDKPVQLQKNVSTVVHVNDLKKEPQKPFREKEENKKQKNDIPANMGFDIPGQAPASPTTAAVNDKTDVETGKKSILSSFFGTRKKESEEKKEPVPVKQPQADVPAVTQARTPENQEGFVVTLQQQTISNTTVLNDGHSDHTTVLSLKDSNESKLPYLLREKNSEKIFIQKSVFRMGKEKSYVDYCISNNKTISRSHADIVKRDSEYFIRDNNSTNGTFIDGARIGGNQETKLSHGSKIGLSDEQFEFRMY